VRAYAVDRAHAVDRLPGVPAFQDDQVPADIGWLLFEPDRLAVGTLLLEAALAWIGDDAEGIEAFELAHGLGWGGGIPMAWQHIDEVITRRGFAWHDTSYLMWGEGTPWFGGSVNQDVRVELEIDASNDWQFRAQVDGRRVGELLAQPMDSPTGWQPTWRGGRWIDWVHVDQALRRRSIAAALFAALAQEARRSGIVRMAGSTRYPAAIRLNERLGLVSRLVLRHYMLDSRRPGGRPSVR
jgi:GNAT superfamily N-acetyltransferase